MNTKRTIIFTAIITIAVVFGTVSNTWGHPCETENGRERPAHVKKDKLDRLPDKHRLLRGLDLSDEQRILLRDLKNQFRERTKALRVRFKEAMLDVLTEEQQKELRERLENPKPPKRRPDKRPEGDFPKTDETKRKVEKPVDDEETWGEIKNKF